ncbi:MAG: MBL fold metallo-hydrolase, partial [Clostridia bacterium]|nr:MBL fold metallo-hydrolase [Clostridia bacterium]
MKITCLAENTTIDNQLTAEHGLSLYIEIKNRKILFDMGQSGAFADNAQKLGIDLSAVDIAVISHGHYDHGGGLATFLEINERTPIYLSRYAFEPHYNGTEKYIGLNTSLAHSDRLVFTKDSLDIGDGLSLHHCNDKDRPNDLGSFGLTVMQEGVFLPDDFRHEQYLMIEEHGKRVLISGCSHKGILDIVRWFEPDVLIGGFHFSKIEAGDALAGYARQLDDMRTTFYTCHCTGAEQFGFMRDRMDRLFYLSTGQS